MAQDSQKNSPEQPKNKNYVVSTRKGFPYPSRVRAGITFVAGSEHNISLTKEQYDLIKADTELDVREAGKKEVKNENPESDSLEQAKTRPSGNHANVKAGYNGAGTVPANPDTEDSATGDTQSAPSGDSQGSSQKSREDQIKSLLKSNSRDKLLAEAKKQKVEVPESAEKKQIAEAIVDHQTAAQE